MAKEIDLEAVLRAYLCADPEKPVDVTMRINDEGRIVAKIGSGVDAPEYVVFGNNVCQYPPPKPPTQRAAVQGFDSHKGMGERQCQPQPSLSYGSTVPLMSWVIPPHQSSGGPSKKS
jgi:hypothetical protein